jgi:hypothetical protein
MISKQFKRPAEAGFGIGDDRHEPVALSAAFGMLDLVGPLQRLVDALAEFGTGIGGIERLIRIHGAGRVRIGGDLPAGEIDGLEARADHLHGLIAGEGAERVDIILALQELPEPLRTATGERIFDRQGSAEALDLGRIIRAGDTLEAIGGSGNKVGEVGHEAPRS